MFQETTTSATVNWLTPPAFVKPIVEAFSITLDVCADRPNVCQRFYSQEQDGLAQDWAGETYWMNPPYGRSGNITAWLHKAAASAHQPYTLGAVLMPARTSTRWWQMYAPMATLLCFLKQRVTFINGDTGERQNSAKFPNCLAIYAPGYMISKEQRELVHSLGWTVETNLFRSGKGK